jgi:hypothetical protein
MITPTILFSAFLLATLAVFSAYKRAASLHPMPLD